MKKVKKNILFPELSYKIIGCLFNVYRAIGSGHRERYYQNAIKQEFRDNKIKFEEQVYYPLTYKDVNIGKNFLDFLIENKIILEIKVSPCFKKQYLSQVLEYLKTNNLKLGIIAIFTSSGVRYYRVVNIS